MSKVFVVDTQQRPLNPVHPGRARLLLAQGKAAVYRRYPFTLVLKAVVEDPVLEPLRLKLDPGSKTTGIALLNDVRGEVIFAAELSHRGEQIKQRLAARRAVRRSRRQRTTRYRKPRFTNRRRRAGWLAPSLESRLANITTWVSRLRRWCPISALSMELVKFDFQQMGHPEISGVEYQQGTLAGYELRQYLLEKWNRTCAYCGAKEVPLQIEHMHPRSQGGTDRVANLCLACEPCNSAKGALPLAVFLAKKPDVLQRILAHAKAPLKDAAAVNSTRWALYERLKATMLPIECGSGGLTTYNRSTRGLPKQHWLDAANVGKSTPEVLKIKGLMPLLITARGHGCRQVCRMDTYGFPRTGPKQASVVKGFQTGDMVKAVVPSGKKQGTYWGRVAVRRTGSFNITTRQGTIQGISHRFCRVLQHNDGYSYLKGAAAFPPVA